MKRTGHLFERATDVASIKHAIAAASKGKANRPEVRSVLSDIDNAAEAIRGIALAGYKPSNGVKRMKVIDGPSKKQREVYKLPFFPDQCIEWAVAEALRPILERGLDPYSVGSVRGRGGAAGKKAVERFYNNDRKGTKWSLYYDVRHFYQSAPQEKVLSALRTKIKDERFLRLVAQLMGVAPTGLAMGTYLSQILGNFYLQRLDHTIRESMKAEHMVRNVDDTIVFSGNKRKLSNIRKSIIGELASLGLEMKPNWRISRTRDEGTDFVGYRIFPNGKSEIRKRVFRSVRRTALRLRFHGVSKKRSKRMMSYYGFVKNTNSNKVISRYLKNPDLIEKSRAAIRSPEKEQKA